MWLSAEHPVQATADAHLFFWRLTTVTSKFIKQNTVRRPFCLSITRIQINLETRGRRFFLKGSSSCKAVLLRWIYTSLGIQTKYFFLCALSDKHTLLKVCSAFNCTKLSSQPQQQHQKTHYFNFLLNMSVKNCTNISSSSMKCHAQTSIQIHQTSCIQTSVPKLNLHLL